jgi:hypothetical protein
MRSSSIPGRFEAPAIAKVARETLKRWRERTEEEMAEKASIRVAAVQLAPDLETPGGTVSKVLGAIAEAAEKGARLIVFPETFVPWYPYFSFVYPPVLTGAEHIRLYENAVVVPGDRGGLIRLTTARRRRRARRQ